MKSTKNSIKHYCINSQHIIILSLDDWKFLQTNPNPVIDRDRVAGIDTSAGYAHGVFGGITRRVRRDDHGEFQEGNHALLWNMGNLAGVNISFILGFRLPSKLR